MREGDHPARAAECVQMAHRVEPSFERATLLDIASKWLLLAGDTPETRNIMDLIEPMRQRIYPRHPSP
jgi:hypothetical protein